VNELAAGTLLGHYKIVRRLGQGGMGVVYEAADQKLGRHVAVKLLTEATRDSSAAVERFWREARAASALNHPGICTIYELNETAESPFIVMELLEGSSLEKLYPATPCLIRSWWRWACNWPTRSMPPIARAYCIATSSRRIFHHQVRPGQAAGFRAGEG
jgi:serine/threonine protein kinase